MGAQAKDYGHDCALDTLGQNAPGVHMHNMRRGPAKQEGPMCWTPTCAALVRRHFANPEKPRRARGNGYVDGYHSASVRSR